MRRNWLLLSLGLTLLALLGLLATPAGAQVAGQYVRRAGDFMTGNLSPVVAATYNLGEAARRWNALYVVTLRDAADLTRISIGSAVGTVNRAAVADGAAAGAHTFGNSASLTSGNDRYVVQFYRDNFSTNTANITTAGFFLQPAQTVTIADDGAGTAPTQAVTPTSNNIQVTCNDANGCNVTLSETAAVAGLGVVTFLNLGTNVANFADTAGTSETAGAFAAGQYDSIQYVYGSDRWIETSRSNN